MNIFAKHKNILLSIVGLVLVFFGYWYFVLSKKNITNDSRAGTGGLVKSTENAASVQPASKGYDKEFVSGLLSLNTINLDVTIFDSVVYKALSFPEKPFAVDYNIPYGRQNPFLPIGINAVGISSSITTQNPVSIEEAPVVPAPEVVASTTPAPAVSSSTQPTKKTFPAVTPKR